MHLWLKCNKWKSVWDSCCAWNFIQESQKGRRCFVIGALSRRRRNETHLPKMVMSHVRSIVGIPWRAWGLGQRQTITNGRFIHNTINRWNEKMYSFVSLPFASFVVDTESETFCACGTTTMTKHARQLLTASSMTYDAFIDSNISSLAQALQVLINTYTRDKYFRDENSC